MTQPVSNWNLFANPVFRRYAVSSLRPLRLVVTIMITQILAAFSWLMGFYGYALMQQAAEQSDSISVEQINELLKANAQPAAVTAWIPILLLQALLSYIGGTARVATGVAAESQTGMMDAFRLTPVRPFAKLSGQLLGLPIHTTVLSLLLMPWAFLSAWAGDIPLDILFRVYLIFWTGALMHHALGLAAGTFIRQKVLAGTLSQVSILVLNFVIPGMGFAGLGMLGHFSFFTAIKGEFLPLFSGTGLTIAESRVQFFDLSVSTSGYHWLVTLLALGFLALALHRRWIDSTSQLFGKIGTVLLASSILFFTCGEMLPQITASAEAAQAEAVSFGPKVLFDAQLSEMSSNRGDANREPTHDLSLASIAFIFGLLLLVLTGSLAPSDWARVRARRQGRPVPLWDDGRAAWGWIAAIALLATGAWAFLAGAGADATATIGKPSFTLVCRLAAALLLLCFVAQSVLLNVGWKGLLLGLFLAGLVPYLLFFAIALTSLQPYPGIMAISPLSLPVLAVSPGHMFFGFAFGLYLTLFIVFQGRLIRRDRKRREAPAQAAPPSKPTP